MVESIYASYTGTNLYGGVGGVESHFVNKKQNDEKFDIKTPSDVGSQNNREKVEKQTFSADVSFEPVSSSTLYNTTSISQNSKSSKNNEKQDSSQAKPTEKKEENTAKDKAGQSEEELTTQEQRLVEKMKVTDRKVRAHERAHKAVGGAYAGAISYEYDKGPDDKRYVVGGEVPIDASPVAGNPKATITKMKIVKAAALAPADPSAQDRKVAAQAEATMRQARVELRKSNLEEKQQRQEASETKTKELEKTNAKETAHTKATKAYGWLSQRENEKKASINLDKNTSENNLSIAV